MNSVKKVIKTCYTANVHLRLLSGSAKPMKNSWGLPTKSAWKPRPLSYSYYNNRNINPVPKFRLKSLVLVSKFEGQPIYSQPGQKFISSVHRHLNYLCPHILILNTQVQFPKCQSTLPSSVFLKEAFSNEICFLFSQEYVTLPLTSPAANSNGIIQGIC